MTLPKDALEIDLPFHMTDRDWLSSFLNEIVDDRTEIQVRFYSCFGWPWPTKPVTRTMTTKNPKGFTTQAFIDGIIDVYLKEGAGRATDHVFFEGAKMADDGIWDFHTGS